MCYPSIFAFGDIPSCVLPASGQRCISDRTIICTSIAGRVQCLGHIRNQILRTLEPGMDSEQRTSADPCADATRGRWIDKQRKAFIATPRQSDSKQPQGLEKAG
jgi:hypothetical protein